VIQKIKDFFKEVKVEAKKVNYPSREELIGSIWVVITTVIVISVYLGVIDMGLSKMVSVLVR
jgi:preprotein translocase subunit SecE